MTGRLITFEGGEGAGKSTQIARTEAYLQSLGYQVVLTRQPGGTDYGQRIRHLILEHHPSEVLASRAELFLYLADRAHHVEALIRPALQAGKIVICDRYADSTLAYQGYGRGLDIAELKLLNQIATANLKPDLTIWLDLDPALGQERIASRASKDRLESEALGFHQKVRAGYQALASEEPQRWFRLDASQDVDAIFQQIQIKLQTWLA